MAAGLVKVHRDGRVRARLSEPRVKSRYLSRAIKPLGAILFGMIVVRFPWPDIWYRLDGFAMVDRTVYLNQISQFELRIDYFAYSRIPDYVIEEFLWGWTLRTASNFGFSGEQILGGIAFAFLALSALIVLRELPWPFLFFLINPLTLALAFSQSRTALMLSLLFAAYLLWSRWRLAAILLAALSPLVHTSAPLFIFLYVACQIGARSRPSRSTTLVPILAGAIVSATAGPLLDGLLTFLNDRRADYIDMSSGLLFLSFWVVCLGHMVIAWPRLGTHDLSRLALSIFSLASFSLIFGSYASRFLAGLFAIIVVALCRDVSIQRRSPLIVIMLAVYVAMLWIYKLL